MPCTASLLYISTLIWLQKVSIAFLLFIHIFTNFKPMTRKFIIFKRSAKCYTQTILRLHWQLIFSNVICPKLQVWVGYLIYLHLCSFNHWFQWMFCSTLNEINRLWKEFNRLLIKGISNIHLKITIEKKWHTQNFDFLSLKS